MKGTARTFGESSGKVANATCAGARKRAGLLLPLPLPHATPLLRLPSKRLYARDRRGSRGLVCQSVAAELGFKGYEGVYWAE